ncbi:MAG TPA: BREX system ATP-binding domain-containing protein [Candidatus Acidoferrum sp.]|nr:BREX system ATP-binding domain-containing protein [Candidatus Acidoferrum sp.]
MLVGRKHELGNLERLLENAALGGGGLRVLAGEAGIGKTRLADEVSARALGRDFAVSWGRSSETGGAPAYDPWIQLLAPLVEARADAPARVSALITGATGPDPGEAARTDPGRERLDLFESVASFLRQRAQVIPLLLVFDDLHMADRDSLELLAFVARRLRSTRLAVVATLRDAEARAPAIADVVARVVREGERIVLRPLSMSEVEEVAHRELVAADADLCRELYVVTEGNPLFLLEALHAIAARPPGASLALLRQVAVTGGVLGVVRGRMASARPELAALLEAAAVLGREVWPPLLAEIAGRPVSEVDDLLGEAAARGLMIRRGEDRWAFGHLLVRQAFHDDLAPARRCALHAAAAAALARRVEDGRTDELAALAHHALCALPVGDPVEASRMARRAADRARAQLAWDEAIAILERALSICGRFGMGDRERAEIELALGWAATEAGQLERGRGMFRDVGQTARRLGDARLLGRAALGQGGEYVLGEIREELVASLDEALAAQGDASEVEDVRLRARLLARLAAALMPVGRQSRPDEPLALARRALAMVDGDSDRRTCIDVDLAAGSALCAFAAPAERVPVHERLLRGARDIGDRVLELRALSRLACDYLERGDLAAADAVIAMRGALGETLGHARYRWQSPLVRSMRAMPGGGFDACEAEIAEARSIARQVEDAGAERTIELHRFFMLVLAGRSEALAEQESAALRALSSLPSYEGRVGFMTGLTAARLGDHARARARLSAIGAESVNWSRLWSAAAAEAAVLCGARTIYELLDATLVADDNPIVCTGPFAFACWPPIAHAQGIVAFALGRPEEAARRCQHALGLAERIGARACIAWIELAWGEGLTGEPGGRSHLDRALAIAEDLRMPDVATRARAALEATTSPGRQRAARAAAPVFSMSDDGREWSIAHAGRVHRMRSVRGLAMLKRLVENPHVEIHALDLCVDPAAGASRAFDLGDAGPILDPRARREYRARLAELGAELEEAERFQDTGRAARLRVEVDALTGQLSAAFGLGSRERRAGSAVERARIVVQRRVREAIKRIGDHDSELGRHLDWTVRTGTFCAYEPEGRRVR